MKHAVPTIGLIVPPAHGRVPPDAAEIYGNRIRFIGSGLGAGSISADAFDSVVETIVDRALQLRDAGAEAITLLGTSLSFYRGLAFTDELQATMQKATGVPCTTLSHSIVEAFRRLGISRLAIGTAYTDDLNDQLRRYLEGLGFQVSAIRGLAITDLQTVENVATPALVALGEAVYAADASAQGVFISCAGLPTLEAVRQLEAKLGVPVVASSPAGLWDVVRLARHDPRASGVGSLFAVDHRTAPGFARR